MLVTNTHFWWGMIRKRWNIETIGSFKQKWKEIEFRYLGLSWNGKKKKTIAASILKLLRVNVKKIAKTWMMKVLKTLSQIESQEKISLRVKLLTCFSREPQVASTKLRIWGIETERQRTKDRFEIYVWKECWAWLMELLEVKYRVLTVSKKTVWPKKPCTQNHFDYLRPKVTLVH